MSSATTHSDEILTQVARFAKAFQQADVEQLSALLGPQYVHTNTGGSVVDREQWLAFIRSRHAELQTGTLQLTRYENLDLEVRLHGNVAIVTGVNVSEGSRHGNAFARELRFTQVWLCCDGDWLRVAFHDTEVVK